MSINLYDDQQELVHDARQALRKNKSILVQAATGAGKTVISASMIHGTLAKGTRSMFVVPRKTLLRQTAETLQEYHIPFTFFAAGYTYNPFAKTILASAQTLAARFDRMPDVDIVFFDECHFGGADLDRIIKYYRAKGKFIIGLSATPTKLDGRGMDEWYDDMVCGKSVRWLMDNNRLSDYSLFAPNTPDLTKVKVTGGDYNKAQLNTLMEMDSLIIGDAVKHYKERAMGKLGLTFGTSIKHCGIIAEQYRAAGIPAVAVDGTTPEDELKAAIKAFARREILQLVNCELLTFGFDLASAAGMKVTVESMHDLQPTKSLAKQMQKNGRVLRYELGKEALIFDHAGNWLRHGLPDEDREWSLDGKDKKKSEGEKAMPVRQCPECFFAHRPAPVCPNCSYEYPIKSREVDEQEGELVQIDKNELRRQAEVERQTRIRRQHQARTLDELIKLGTEWGYQKPEFWAAKIYSARAAKR